jgi:3-hydroxy-3-methylglutaryl CoA synthase
LAVEAARACQTHAPQQLTLASTSLPFADRSNAGLVAAALDWPNHLATLDVTGSQRAGSSALIAATQMVRASTVIASDSRLARIGGNAELSYGAAATAVRVERAASTAIAEVHAANSVAADFVDHYRASDALFDYGFEERWVREAGVFELVPSAITATLARAGIEAQAVRHLAMSGSTAMVQTLAKQCGLTAAATDASVQRDCGDAGVAGPLLQLVGALERAAAGEWILLVAFGQGVDCLLLRRGAAPLDSPLARALARKRDETSYVRYLSHAGLAEVDFGMRAERDHRTAQSVAWRKRRVVTGFVGGKCSACGTVQYPRARVCVSPACRQTDTQTDHRLADTPGRVKTFTEDWQAYSPRPPYCYGNVEFVDGGNLLMEFTDVDPGEIHVGDDVRFVFRIKDFDRVRGFRRYFWKATKA